MGGEGGGEAGRCHTTYNRILNRQTGGGMGGDGGGGLAFDVIKTLQHDIDLFGTVNPSHRAASIT